MSSAADSPPDQTLDLTACKSAGRPRTADMAARTQHLIDTASLLFLDKGYSNVSLEMIARQAHVAVRTIYVKFGGKAGLFNAVIGRERKTYFSNMSDIQTDMRPLEQILADFGLRFLSLVTTPAAVDLHKMVVAEAKTNPELATTFHMAGPAQTREMLLSLFKRPDIACRFRPEVAHERLAIHLINCLLGDQLSRQLFPRTTPPSLEENHSKVAQGLDLFFHGTLRLPAEGQSFGESSS